MSSNLIVITFDNPEEAVNVRESLKKTEKGGYLRLDDSAVIVKDADGKIHIKDEVDRGIKAGIGGGSLLGLMIGFMFGGPLGGLVVGAVTGGVAGALSGLGLDKKFIKEVTEGLEPNSSAIFFIVRDSNPDVAISALKPYQGTIYHTSLSPEDEETLKRVLSKKM